MITAAQRESAEQQQWNAARDGAAQIRLVAGPGTGKSRTIEKRVLHVLQAGADPETVYVISFTRATCAELRSRIVGFLSGAGYGDGAEKVHVSTMHSLALGILRRASLLNQYPSDPRVLDTWEQGNIYDPELAVALACNRSRAAEVRLAHDASWQTLDPSEIAQASIAQSEVIGFNQFHGSRTNLYSCVLPGEVIYRCVENYSHGQLTPENTPAISHLIVDEFQDLNACDQAFVRYLAAGGAVLFVAGDDDQSIYSFRHADPSGIVNFDSTYPGSASHNLTDCFRCTPSVLGPALALVSHNPNRLDKRLNALYGDAEPPVPGILRAWSFATAEDEARGIAQSCAELIHSGMAGEEDQILILLAQRKPASVQLEPIVRELSNLGLPYIEVSSGSLSEDPGLRAVYALLRIVRDLEAPEKDYLAYRTLVALLSGIGEQTARRIGDECVQHNANYREIFHSTTPLPWLTGRGASAVTRVRSIVAAINDWSLTDTLASRMQGIGQILSQQIFNAPGQSADLLAEWYSFAGTLPQDMTLSELCEYLGAANSEQLAVMGRVNARLGIASESAEEGKKIRILTMHGAKGLTSKVVFIPSACQDIIPDRRSLNAPGLLVEKRRLFYVSVTRAMAACIVSHATTYRGAAAQALRQRSVARLTRSQFLNEMGLASTNRTGGLTSEEAAEIVSAVRSL